MKNHSRQSRPSGENITAAVTAAANILSQGMSIDEMNLLAVLFSMLGDAIGVIAAARSIGSDEDDVTVP